ncbi:MAG: twin transmembrane helix small protein [Tepidimonas sp.]|nr:twin transmembrane helix small protein [Tepidimonas sp.]
MKMLVLLAFIGIVASLGTALVAMMRGDSSSGDPQRSRRMARALTMRIGLSVLLFVLLILSHTMGWIQPTGLPVR